MANTITVKIVRNGLNPSISMTSSGGKDWEDFNLDLDIAGDVGAGHTFDASYHSSDKGGGGRLERKKMAQIRGNSTKVETFSSLVENGVLMVSVKLGAKTHTSSIHIPGKVAQ